MKDITLKDMFAAAAMIGLIAKNGIKESSETHPIEIMQDMHNYYTKLADQSYTIACFMVGAREG